MTKKKTKKKSYSLKEHKAIAAELIRMEETLAAMWAGDEAVYPTSSAVGERIKKAGKALNMLHSELETDCMLEHGSSAPYERAKAYAFN